MNAFDNQKRQWSVDALLNSDTVKEYVNEEYEKERYAATMRKFQKKEMGFIITGVSIDLVQTLVLMAGYGSCCVLCILMVEHLSGLTVGDYVLMSTYILQIFHPLSSIGLYYRWVFVQISVFLVERAHATGPTCRIMLKATVDMENMLDLFNVKPEIIDHPFVSSFNVVGGEVEFKNVSFGYSPEKAVLNNVSLKIPAGHTVAIVSSVRADVHKSRNLSTC